MAALRSAHLALLRRAGWRNIAEAHRHYAWSPGKALRLLGLTRLDYRKTLLRKLRRLRAPRIVAYTGAGADVSLVRYTWPCAIICGAAAGL